MRRCLENAKAHLPDGYLIVPVQLIRHARAIIDGPPGPGVGPEEYAAWDETHTTELAEQLALLPRV